jgi:hypothetical protein
MVENTTALADRTKDASSTNDAQAYVLAIDQIRAAITRHREYIDSLDDAKQNSHHIVEESHRSQSPVGFTNDAKTIEEIVRILEEVDRNHPPPKLSHDSSKIEEDLLSTADDSVQIIAPSVCQHHPCLTPLLFAILYSPFLASHRSSLDNSRTCNWTHSSRKF